MQKAKRYFFFLLNNYAVGYSKKVIHQNPNTATLAPI